MDFITFYACTKEHLVMSAKITLSIALVLNGELKSVRLFISNVLLLKGTYYIFITELIKEG